MGNGPAVKNYFILVNVMNKELILSLLMPLIWRGMSDLNLPQGTRENLRKEEKLTIMSFLRKEKNEKNVGGTKLGITKISQLNVSYNFGKSCGEFLAFYSRKCPF